MNTLKKFYTDITPLEARFGLKLVHPGVLFSDGVAPLGNDWDDIFNATRSLKNSGILVGLLRHAKPLSHTGGRARLYVPGVSIDEETRSGLEGLLMRLNFELGYILPCERFEVIQRSDFVAFAESHDFNPVLVSSALNLLDHVLYSPYRVTYIESDTTDVLATIEQFFNVWTKILPYDFGRMVHVSLRDWVRMDGQDLTDNSAIASSYIGAANISLITCAEHGSSLSTEDARSLSTAINYANDSGQAAIVVGRKPFAELAEKYQLWGDISDHATSQVLTINYNDLEKIMLPSDHKTTNVDQLFMASKGANLPAMEAGDSSNSAEQSAFYTNTLLDQRLTIDGLIEQLVETAALVLNVKVSGLCALNGLLPLPHKARSLFSYGISCLPAVPISSFIQVMHYEDQVAFVADITKGSKLVETDESAVKAFSLLMQELFVVYSESFEREDDVLSTPELDPADNYADNVVQFPTSVENRNSVFSRFLQEI